MKKIIVLALILVLLACGTGYSAQATLSWSPNSESHLLGYKVHYGKTSKDATGFMKYDNEDDVGNVTSYLVTGLAVGETYYFAATAYGLGGAKSDYSNEVSYEVPYSPLAPPRNLILPDVNTLKWEANKGEWFAYYNVYKDNEIGLQILGDPIIESFKIPHGWNKEVAEFFVTTVNYGFPFIESMPSNSIWLIFKGRKWRNL